jgi:hypothetical protein
LPRVQPRQIRGRSLIAAALTQTGDQVSYITIVTTVEKTIIKVLASDIWAHDPNVKGVNDDALDKAFERAGVLGNVTNESLIAACIKIIPMFNFAFNWNKKDRIEPVDFEIEVTLRK